MRILKESYAEAKRLLGDNREAMDQIAEFLIEKETITGKEFMEIFRRVKEQEKAASQEDKNEDIAVAETPAVGAEKETEEVHEDGAADSQEMPVAEEAHMEAEAAAEAEAEENAQP